MDLGRFSVELRAAPGSLQTLRQLARDVAGRESGLLERVAVAQGHRAVLERPTVDGYAPRRADLVLSAIAAADGPALVVLGRDLGPHRVEDLARSLRHPVPGDEREDGGLHRRQS